MVLVERREAGGVGEDDGVVGAGGDQGQLARLRLLHAQAGALLGELGGQALEVVVGHALGLQNLEQVQGLVVQGEVPLAQAQPLHVPGIGQPGGGQHEEAGGLGAFQHLTAQGETGVEGFQLNQQISGGAEEFGGQRTRRALQAEDRVHPGPGKGRRAHLGQAGSAGDNAHALVPAQVEGEGAGERVGSEAGAGWFGRIHAGFGSPQVTAKTSWSAPWSLCWIKVEEHGVP